MTQAITVLEEALNRLDRNLRQLTAMVIVNLVLTACVAVVVWIK